MKFLKLSLAASVALGALSTASFAQSLEEAIKGVDVSGYLRYRYTDDRLNDDYTNWNFGAKHQWKAQADLKTPVINNVAVNLGLLYTQDNNVNHGKGNGDSKYGDLAGESTLPDSSPNTGKGLGAGGDNSFNVQTFYATITPDSTATVVTIGKQLINTPITAASDGDRGTGIVATNSDIEGLTLAAAVFDSWASDDRTGYSLGKDKSDESIAKNLYGLGGVYNLETSFGNLGFQLWGFNITDTADAIVFGEGSWKNDFLRAKLQYTFAALNNDEDSALILEAGSVGKHVDVAAENDLAIIELGANFSTFSVPLDLRLGYMMNFMDGIAIALNDDAENFTKAGKIWYDDSYVGFNTSIFNGGLADINWETEAKVIFGALGYSMVDDRLNLGLEAAYGNIEKTAGKDSKLAIAAAGGKKENSKDITMSDIKFVEVTPTISWKHSDKLNLSAFYAYLAAENDVKGSKDYDRQRVRFEAKYSF